MDINLVWYVLGAMAVCGFFGWLGYCIRLVQELWRQTAGYEAPPALDWSETQPSPQQIAFEEMMRWQRIRQQWEYVDPNNH